MSVLRARGGHGRGECQLGAGLSVTRGPALDAGETARRAARDDRARRVLEAYAAEQGDPAGWLGDMLDTLGLRPGAEPIREQA